MMRVCLFLLLSFFAVVSTYSQNNKTMIDSITAQTPGKGTITIHQEPEIANLIGKINTSGAPLKSSTVNKRGFRIQVFSGSQKQTAKDEAYSRERKLRNRFPEYGTYVTFNSPFWKLRVGDFADRYDAEEALNAIKKGCPEYGSDLYIVPDNVKVVE